MYITERIKFILLIVLAGGMMDAYSFIIRGGVFATGQTGNFVLLGVNLLQFNLTKALTYLIPITAFWIGVFISNFLVYKEFVKHKLHLQHNILVLEIVLFIVVAFLPIKSANIIANTITSFCASLQFCAFRTIENEATYSSVFCTGNMRSCAEAMFEWIINKNNSKKNMAIKYLLILSSFFVGVLFGGIINQIFKQYSSIGISCVLIFAVYKIRKNYV